MTTLSIYGSHHAALAVEKDGKYLILEAAHYLNRPCSGLTHFHPLKTPEQTAREMYMQLANQLPIDTPPTVYLYSDLGVAAPFFATMFNADKAACQFVSHHVAHAANSFYQSPFDRALVITCDSGGDDGTFNIYAMCRSEEPSLIARIPLQLGYTYSTFGAFITSIRQADGGKVSFLDYANKIMNLAAYGSVRQDWLPHIEKIFRAEPLSSSTELHLPLEPYNAQDLTLLCATLSLMLEQPLHIGIDGLVAYDLAATVQRALENVYISAVSPHLLNYPAVPICLGGGVAKNIYLNRRIKEEFGRELFVPVNCDNSGIALGMIVATHKPSQPVTFTHAGPQLLDRSRLHHLASLRQHCEATPRRVARIIADGKILGIARDQADHGSYSLGNRSIVCDAGAPNIGHVIRRVIKKTPSFIPFDALIREEKIAEYIHDAPRFSYPNYPLLLKDEFRSVFSSITHPDGTVRVYTVEKSRDPWLHELLRWFETYSGHSVLLTTPLHREGEATVSSIEAALHLLDSTLLDGLVADNLLLWRLPGGTKQPHDSE